MNCLIAAKYRPLEIELSDGDRCQSIRASRQPNPCKARPNTIQRLSFQSLPSSHLDNGPVLSNENYYHVLGEVEGGTIEPSVDRTVNNRGLPTNFANRERHAGHSWSRFGSSQTTADLCTLGAHCAHPGSVVLT